MFRFFRLNQDTIMRGPKGSHKGRPVCMVCFHDIPRHTGRPCNSCGNETHYTCLSRTQTSWGFCGVCLSYD